MNQKFPGINGYRIKLHALIVPIVRRKDSMQAGILAVQALMHKLLIALEEILISDFQPQAKLYCMMPPEFVQL